MNIRHSHRSFVQDRPVTNLIELFEEITKNDEVRIVDTVYMDFSKTLDKIPYIVGWFRRLSCKSSSW